jgi:hypothetical protein
MVIERQEIMRGMVVTEEVKIVNKNYENSEDIDVPPLLAITKSVHITREASVETKTSLAWS